ncbi:MAG: RND family transporter [Mycobacterium sp.]|uniref:MMPL/RND family transporter n=1 Tax=Mycobacterium sp. TaxID=1785 RepID=UPI003C4FDD38
MSRGAQVATMPEANGLFGRLGVFVVRWPWVVIGFWVALAAVLSVTLPPLTKMANERPVAILPSDAPVLVTTKQISEAFHQSGSENENVLLVVLTDETGLDPSDEAIYRALADNLRPDTRDIVMMQDFITTPALREAMTSKDHKAWYLPMVIAGAVGSPDLHAAFGRVADIVKHTVAGSTLRANLTGPAASGDDLMYIGIRDMHVIETAVVLMVLTILFVIYRNPVTMMLPLITIGVSVMTAQAIVAGIAELGLGVTTQTITLMTTMMAGAGIDYAVFLISRYHDYLRQGEDSNQAVLKALTSIGKVIAGSAATVSITFLGMSFTHLGAFRTIGPALAISIAVALLAALTFLPALLVLAGPRGWIRPRRDLTARFWRHLGERIAHRPVAHLIASLTVLIVLAGCATLARYNYDDSKTLPKSVESAVGYATLAQHFPLNATIPEYLVVQSRRDLREPAALADLKQMEQRVKQLSDIATIRGAPPPTGKSKGQTSAVGGAANGPSNGSAFAGNTDADSDGGGVDAFPNVAGMLYPLANTDSGSPDDGEQGKPAGEADDAAMFVSTVRALGFALNLDVAEIANTLNAAPVTVLDVGATTESDGGALQKIGGFAEKLQSLPDAKTIELAARNMRQVLNDAANDLRAMGIGDPTDVKDRQPDPQRDAHTYSEAIRQLIDGIKALVHQTTHIAGGLTSALTSFISPDGHTARYLVQTKLNPFGTDGMNQIHKIVDAARGPHPNATLTNASISVSGVTAMLRDTRAYYNQDIRLIIGMTILIVFLILVALLRAIVAPLYLIASVVVSYLSALGLGVIVFQFMLHQGLTWSVPGLTFIVLVAMGADYNLLLISRLRDESPHGIRAGVIHTVGSTGGVITAAGVIFAASMFGMMFASINTLVQAGFIIGTGLLLDTFLVRTITVPAIAVLVGQANWWPSRLPPRSEQTPTTDSGPASEAPDDTAQLQDAGAGRHEKHTEVADGTESEIVALRS